MYSKQLSMKKKNIKINPHDFVFINLDLQDPGANIIIPVFFFQFHIHDEKLPYKLIYIPNG